MRALIIEDEARARDHMKNLLAQHFPQAEVAGAVGSVKDAVEWLLANPDPDVIFMDVELTDGISFDIFNKVEINSPVIVTTAYDQYAVQAFEVNAVDYLLKPIEIKDLQRAMARIASGEAKAPSADAVLNLLDQARKEKFLIRLNDRIVPVRVSDIAYFYSEDKNTYMVTVSGTSYVLDDSLDALVETLDPDAFFRISRSCIMAEKSIDSVSKLMGGRLRISPKAGIAVLSDFTVSRARVDGFMKWLEQ
ncbi:MAG: response regulator transcription factor [Bacteroidales bacterium]|nr:response regulator transcription factor [Bacteroidales bacterium]